MEGSKVTSTHDFLESAAGDLPALEAKLSSRLRELCERNAELSRRNAELRGSAEIGWNAELQIKKMAAIESDLTEQVRDLQYEREIFASAIAEEKLKTESLKKSVEVLERQIAQLEDNRRSLQNEMAARLGQAEKTEQILKAEMATLALRHDQALKEIESRRDTVKEDEIAALKSALALRISESQNEITALRSAAGEAKAAFEKNYTIMRAQLDQARADEEERLAEIDELSTAHEAALAEIRRRHEQTLALAQESFHAQLTELGKTAWNAGAEARELALALTAAKNECARLQSSLDEQEAMFRAQLTELAQSGWESENELRELKRTQTETSAAFDSERSALKKTNAELRRAFENERQTLAQTSKREVEIRAIAEKAQTEAKAFAREAAQASEDKRRAVAEVLSAKNAELAVAFEAKILAERNFEAQKSAVNHMSGELHAKIRELRDSQETIQKQMTVIGEQSRTSQDKSAEIAALRAKLETTQGQVALQGETMRLKDAEIEKLNRELKTKEEVNQRQLATLANMSKAEKEKDLEIQRFRFAESSLNESVNELRRAGRERDELRKEFEAHIARLNEQIVQLRANAQNQQELAAQDLLSVNTHLQSTRAQLEAARNAIEEVKSERDYAREQLKLERENAAAMTTIVDQRAENERRELERLSAQLQQREFQLRHYAASVSEEKSEVLRRAKLLADEIRAATTLAPLKDYLALTEFELSKVEMQLRKTPVISIERPRLEANFAQMIEQRDFLKGAIANSQRQLDQQAAQLLKIAKPEKLSPIPPLPPRTTSV